MASGQVPNRKGLLEQEAIFIHFPSCSFIFIHVEVLFLSYISPSFSLGLVQVEEDVACGVLTLLSTCFTDAKAAAARQSFCAEFFHDAFLHGNRVHLDMLYFFCWGKIYWLSSFFPKNPHLRFGNLEKWCWFLVGNSWGTFDKGPMLSQLTPWS